MHPRASWLIETLGLVPHPEGGYFNRIYRSPRIVVPDDGRGERRALTTIYFLLTRGQHSRWHRVLSDEVWHLYEGDPLELMWIVADGGRLVRTTLGPVGAGSRPVQAVPAGSWQAARPFGAYTLAGCTVGPGFEYEDLSLLADCREEREQLLNRFPAAAPWI
jgi:uncharacterized protein